MNDEIKIERDFLVLGISDKDVDMRDLTTGLVVCVDTLIGKQFCKGDVIRAKIYSIPVHGLTMQFNFREEPQIISHAKDAEAFV